MIRSGYQIGYDSFFNNIASNAATSSPNVVASQTSRRPPPARAAAYQLSGLLPVTARALYPRCASAGRPDLVNPYYQRWSLGVQRELPGALIIDVYIGSKGTKLYANESATRKYRPICASHPQASPDPLRAVRQRTGQPRHSLKQRLVHLSMPAR